MLLCGDGEGLLDNYNAAVPLSARERCEKDSTIGVVQLYSLEKQTSEAERQAQQQTLRGNAEAFVPIPACIIMCLSR